MKAHRFIQLIGLYGMLVLIPIFQHQVSYHSSEEESYERKKIFNVVEHLYYDIKNIACTEYGQKASIHDCDKGMYQDLGLSSTVDFERESEENRSTSMKAFLVVYYFFSIIAFLGTGIEYRKEYLQSKG
ncbi:hypothetical protein [Marinimicrobium sp. LS-A18]|uniref:hypothetical protein n=1 Tax=Marinimicrobium sp. LS-A18 TaxID=1381596 RepID=UPI0004638B81|nr:hypothetical protein [Marinimicrobium sp. LS-A18]